SHRALRFLTRNQGQFLLSLVQDLSILGRFTQTHVHNDLLDPRDLVYVTVVKLFHHRRGNLILILRTKRRSITLRQGRFLFFYFRHFLLPGSFRATADVRPPWGNFYYISSCCRTSCKREPP